MGRPSGPRCALLVQMSFAQSFFGLLLLLLYSDFVAAQVDNNQIVLLDLNNTWINTEGNSSITPKIERVNQAACLTPFPCISANITPAIAGQAYYSYPLNFTAPYSFSTMFSFNTLRFPTFTAGEGFVFFLSGNIPTVGDTAGYLGWLNSNTNGDQNGHNFGVEFDLVENTTFQDPPYDHIGINLNSLHSAIVVPADNETLATLSSASKAYIWLNYDGAKKWIDLRLNVENRKPCKSIVYRTLDLSTILTDSMYVGFSASTGGGDGVNVSYNTQTTVFDLSFSPTDQFINIYGDNEHCGLTVSMTVILGVLVGLLGLVILLMASGVYLWSRRVSALDEEKSRLIDELKQLDYGAKEYTLQEITEATVGFKELIGEGGFGKVFKGNLMYISSNKKASNPNTSVAVKQIKKTSDTDDAKQLVAEVKVIGRLRHVNIVPLLGWCYDKRQMLLVYKFLENGDLDQMLFPLDYKMKEHGKFTWGRRISVLRGVAAALKFLHEEFESEATIIHRDVKTRNVMIDRNFNARLGDFGLARLLERGSNSVYQSELLVGTKGYIAPEYLDQGATVETDIYSFGVVCLVVATGRRPLDRTVLQFGGVVGWVRQMYDEGIMGDAGDANVMFGDSSFNRGEMERALKVGLFCCAYEPSHRPLMREVVAALEGSSSIFSSDMPAQGYQGVESSYDLNEDDTTQPFDEGRKDSSADTADPEDKSLV